MDLDTVVYYTRAFNVLTGLAGVSWLLVKVSMYWSKYSRPMRLYIGVMLMYSFGVTYGTSEIMVQHLAPGYRIPMVTVTNLALLYALWATRGQYIKGDLTSYPLK